MKLPNKFEYSNTDGNKFWMTLIGGVYWCTYVGEDAEEGKTSSWQVSTVEHCLEMGTWIITKNLDEPELVLPFTYVYDGGTLVYKAEQGFTTDKVNIVSPTGRKVASDWWTKDQCREFIKTGTWIVKSVGEQKSLEAPTSDDKSVSVLSIRVECKEAVASIKELTEALTLLAEAYEKVINLKERFENV